MLGGIAPPPRRETIGGGQPPGEPEGQTTAHGGGCGGMGTWGRGRRRGAVGWGRGAAAAVVARPARTHARQGAFTSRKEYNADAPFLYHRRL